MSAQPLMRGEIPFPELGEGVALRFSNPDCDLLQKKFGDNWFLDAAARCNRTDTEFLRECIAIGAKVGKDRAKVRWDELEIPMVVISEHVLDGLFVAVFGRKFDEHLSYLESVRMLHAGQEDVPGNASSPATS